MKSLGIIYCCYNSAEHLKSSLPVWVGAKQNLNITIAVTSHPFAEYEGLNVEVDDTSSKLDDFYRRGDIDFLSSGDVYITEAEARNRALEFLLEQECEFVMIADADEYFTYSQLESLQSILENSEFIDWFSIKYKNYVGEGYLEEPFTPPRAFRVNSSKGKLSKFYYDNDVIYENNGEEINYKSLSHKIVPQDLIWCDHYSWTNTKKNKDKIKYQEKHFSHGAGCSYKWDEEKGVIFNDEYYKKTGQVKPKIIYG